VTAWSPGGGTGVAAVIGSPVSHSLSPLIHNAAFRALGMDWVYVAFDVPAGQGGSALEAMRTLGLGGLNVTMPHKAAVATAVDRLAPAAAALGVVNTVVRHHGALVGESTDGAGLLAALEADLAFVPEGRRCVVLGAGGSARAVVLALAGAGAREVAVVARRSAQAEEVVRLASTSRVRAGSVGDVAGAELVVNTTPVGDRLPLELVPGDLGAGQLVVDLLYHPRTSALVQAAGDRGAVATNGLGMLVHQAALAFQLMHGVAMPLDAVHAALEAEPEALRR
jgi:shikimate dehydrogenase